jgi:hypothetical protein
MQAKISNRIQTHSLLVLLIEFVLVQPIGWLPDLQARVAIRWSAEIAHLHKRSTNRAVRAPTEKHPGGLGVR